MLLLLLTTKTDCCYNNNIMSGPSSIPATAAAAVPPLGPEPTLVSRKEMDMLYTLLGAVTAALDALRIDYIVTGGSLLGAIRQGSILFCDDDVDISILDPFYCHDDDDNDERSIYHNRLVPLFGKALGKDFRYKQQAWDGGDRVYYGHSNVFLDLFVICKYRTWQKLYKVIGTKTNGQPQSDEYVRNVVDEITKAAELKRIASSDHGNDGNEESVTALEPPFWHFAQRKAIELWPKEVYRDWELWPLQRNLRMGPHSGISGPCLAVLLLKRAFGDDCFEVYYPSVQHGNNSSTRTSSNPNGYLQDDNHDCSTTALPPKVLPGGTWRHATKLPLEQKHYIPIQPTSKALRSTNDHCKQSLLEYLDTQCQFEERIVQKETKRAPCAEIIKANTHGRPRRTVYMDGVFDLFHVGHLSAIRHCASRGDRVILGVTGDDDATSYKRAPIICQEERSAIVAALAEVDHVVCPCPLVVTESFMQEHGIDLVVHGFVNDKDAEDQFEFFAYPMRNGQFERIPYHDGQSTTSIIRKIQALDPL